MAVFDEISCAEKAQILGAGAQTSYKCRSKSNKIFVKNKESFGGSLNLEKQRPVP